MKSRILVALVALCTLAAPAMAQSVRPLTYPDKQPSRSEPGADPMEGHYGNTLIAWGKGWETHYWYNRDHTFTAFRYRTVNGVTTLEGEKGTWEVRGGPEQGETTGGVCRVSKVRKNRCMNYEMYQKVGDNWIAWWHDEAQHFEIVAGLR